MQKETYLQNSQNSFDSLLIGHNPNMRLYQCPVIITENAWKAFKYCPIFLDNSGFSFKNDTIITNSQKTDNIFSDFNRQLTLKSAKRFYSIYSENENSSEYIYEYVFFNNIAIEGLLFFMNQFCDNVIDPAIVVGAITLYADSRLNKTAKSMTFLLTSRPVEASFYDNEYNTLSTLSVEMLSNEGINNVFTRDLRTRILTMSLVTYFQKEIRKEDIFVFEDRDSAIQIEEYIRENYSMFSDIQKDICVLISPNEYKYLLSDSYRKQIIDSELTALFNVITKYGVSGLIGFENLDMLDEDQSKLISKATNRLIKNPNFVLNQESPKLFQYIVIIWFLNLKTTSNERLIHITGLWLYYNLYRLKDECSLEEIPVINTLISFTLYSNIELFVLILNELKKEKLIINTPSIPSMPSSWNTKSEQWCIYELIYYFNKEDNAYIDELSDKERLYIGNPSFIGDGFNYRSICNYLKSTVGHYFGGIECEREFYAKILFLYIKKEIEVDCYFKNIIK